jgi:hypothetical protein
VKDYKKQKASVNDPLEDCRVTQRLFEEQCAAFAQQPEMAGVFGVLLQEESRAYQALFVELSGKPCPCPVRSRCCAI